MPRISKTIIQGFAGIRRDTDTALAFTLTGLILAVPAATLPVVTVSRFGSERAGVLMSGVGALWNDGMPTLGIWVLTCGSLAPIFLLLALGGLVAAERCGWEPTSLSLLSALAKTVAEWTMPEVQVLAVLVAVAKIGSLVQIETGPGLWCYAGMSLAILIAWSSFQANAGDTGGRAFGENETHPAERNPALATALGVSALVMLVPANLLPVIRTTIGKTRNDTIYSGIISLFDRGLWGIGVIVFVASILVPVLKLAGLTFLLLATKRGPGEHLQRLRRLYAVMNFIGRWSMLDVFLVAFLAGVIQFGTFAEVRPQPGIIAFAMAVVLTMLATRAFDPRWLENGHGREGAA